MGEEEEKKAVVDRTRPPQRYLALLVGEHVHWHVTILAFISKDDLLQLTHINNLQDSIMTGCHITACRVQLFSALRSFPHM